MKILITGIDGYIGWALALKQLSLGNDVCGIDNFSRRKNQRRSGLAGLFSGSLELTKEGNLSIKQNKLFDDIYIKEK